MNTLSRSFSTTGWEDSLPLWMKNTTLVDVHLLSNGYQAKKICGVYIRRIFPNNCIETSPEADATSTRTIDWGDIENITPAIKDFFIKVPVNDSGF